MVPPHLFRNYQQRAVQEQIIEQTHYISHDYIFELGETQLSIKRTRTGRIEAIIDYEKINTVRLDYKSSGTKNNRYRYYTCTINETWAISSKRIYRSFFHSDETDHYKTFISLLHKKLIAFPAPERAYNTGLEKEDYKYQLIVKAILGFMSIVIFVAIVQDLMGLIIPAFFTFAALFGTFCHEPGNYFPHRLPYSFLP